MVLIAQNYKKNGQYEKKVNFLLKKFVVYEFLIYFCREVIHLLFYYLKVIIMKKYLLMIAAVSCFVLVSCDNNENASTSESVSTSASVAQDEFNVDDFGAKLDEAIKGENKEEAQKLLDQANEQLEKLKAAGDEEAQVSFYAKIKKFIEEKAADLKKLGLDKVAAVTALTNIPDNLKAKVDEYAKGLLDNAEGKVEEKAEELKGAAEQKAEELKGAAEQKANEIKGAAEQKAQEVQKQAEQKANDLKNEAAKKIGL